MNSEEIYKQWYESLDEIDKELVDNVDIVNDDDYPLQPRRKLSTEAINRAGVTEYDQQGNIATLTWIPQPPKAYFDAVRSENEIKAQQLQAEQEKARREYQQGVENYKEWETRVLSDLVDVSVWRWIDTLNLQWEEVHRVSSAHGGWATTGDTWNRSSYKGEDIYKVSYGNAVRYRMPQNIADIAYDYEWNWEKENFTMEEARHAALTLELSTSNTFRSDFARWVVNHVGWDTLMEVAKSRTHTRLERITGVVSEEFMSKYSIPYVVLSYSGLAKLADGRLESVYKHTDGSLYVKSGKEQITHDDIVSWV